MITERPSSPVLNGIDIQALSATLTAVREQPELGATTFRNDCTWIDDRRVATTFEGFAAAGAEHERPVPHELTTDLPQALGGTDRGPSPLELALASLGSCVATTLVVHASAKGIPLRSVKVSLSGDLDLRGFLDLADVRVGYEGLELEVALDADLSAAEIADLVESGLRFSPVLELFRSGTRVRTVAAKVDPAGQGS